ncbi:MAG: LON peptidase substrate-binding domain-containing protein [Acidipila sp.]|nr:LON peptidase substrate-binding domain-containing protein [Acidipila sp.]
MEPKRIPLFPLEVVLFPGMPLPLHIFEPRYKQMVAHCREQHVSFGVVLVKGQGIAPTGCTAEIIEVSKEYPDGKLDLLTIGRLAFTILEVFEEREYAEADVEYLEDEPAAEQSSSASLMKIFEQCHELAYGQKPEESDPGSHESLAYHVASELPLDLEYKQSLLEMRNEAQRRHSLESALQNWMDKLEGLAQARRTAGGNGHRRV